MANLNSCSSLFLLTHAFVIFAFASMSAVEDLKCFKCGPVNNATCLGESVDCAPKEICFSVIHKLTNPEGVRSTSRGCLKEGTYKEADVDKCKSQEVLVGGVLETCYCKTDNCNGNGNGNNNDNGSGLLQGSSLSIIVCVIAAAAAFAIYQDQ